MTPRPWTSRSTERVLRLMGWTAAVAVLALIFTLYTRPDFMVGLADKLWACF